MEVAIVAVWVLQGRVRGYSLATGLLGYITLLGLTLVAMVIGQYAGDSIDSPPPLCCSPCWWRSPSPCWPASSGPPRPAPGRDPPGTKGPDPSLPDRSMLVR